MEFENKILGKCKLIRSLNKCALIQIFNDAICNKYIICLDFNLTDFLWQSGMYFNTLDEAWSAFDTIEIFVF